MRFWTVTATMLLVMACYEPLPLMAQAEASVQGTPVQRIRANPASFLDRQVAIVGKIIRYVDTGERDTSAYYIEDDFGIQLRVVTRESLPAVESRWTVSGIIAIDSRSDPYLVEAAREQEISAPAELPPVVVVEPEEPAGWAISPYLLLGVGGLLLFGMVIWMRRPAPAPAPAIAGGPGPFAPGLSTSPVPPGPSAAPVMATAASVAAAPSEFYDGKTVRFHRPSAKDGTLKLLPGRLEILTGPDRGNEVRFVHPGGGTPEITFGRSEGPKFHHIQLTAPTVSRRHALIRFEGSEWNIANFSETNPVVVNEKPLLALGAAQPLKDSDTIEFGEVSFKFHAR